MTKDILSTHLYLSSSLNKKSRIIRANVREIHATKKLLLTNQILIQIHSVFNVEFYCTKFCNLYESTDAIYCPLQQDLLIKCGS